MSDTGNAEKASGRPREVMTSSIAQPIVRFATVQVDRVTQLIVDGGLVEVEGMLDGMPVKLWARPETIEFLKNGERVEGDSVTFGAHDSLGMRFQPE